MAEQKVFDAYAAYYDLLYKDKDYTGEADYVAGLLAKFGGDKGSVLDLGCGTGSHAIALDRLGFAVTGVDLSSSMIEQAKARASIVGAENIKYFQGDLRSFRIEQEYDAVLALFHVMSYQVSNADLKAALVTAYEHLKPGGIFVFDCWYGPGVLTDPPVVRVKRMQSKNVQITRLAEPQHFPNESRVDVHYEVLVEGGDGVQKINECHAMRYLFLPEIDLLLEAQGFQRVLAETWLSGRTPESGTWNICIVAKK